MVTGVIKNKVDKIWTDIWAGGIANPLTVIEQLTYLMFIRLLDEKELENEEFENMTGEQMPKIFPQSEAGQSMRWSKFKNDDPRRIFDVMSQRVFPAIKSMKYGRLPDFNEKDESIKDILFMIDTSGSMSVLNNVIEYYVDRFGSDRILFGTDTYAYSYEFARVAFAEISFEDKENIFWKNAMKLFDKAFK